MTEQTDVVVDPPVGRPACPRCGERPTEVTIPVDDLGLNWQDVCEPCGRKAADDVLVEQKAAVQDGDITAEEVIPLDVVPIAGASEST